MGLPGAARHRRRGLLRRGRALLGDGLTTVAVKKGLGRFSARQFPGRGPRADRGGRARRARRSPAVRPTTPARPARSGSITTPPTTSRGTATAPASRSPSRARSSPAPTTGGRRGSSSTSSAACPAVSEICLRRLTGDSPAPGPGPGSTPSMAFLSVHGAAKSICLFYRPCRECPAVTEIAGRPIVTDEPRRPLEPSPPFSHPGCRTPGRTRSRRPPSSLGCPRHGAPLSPRRGQGFGARTILEGLDFESRPAPAWA